MVKMVRMVMTQEISEYPQRKSYHFFLKTFYFILIAQLSQQVLLGHREDVSSGQVH